MHERNPYKAPIDFVSLAESYEPLKPFLIKTSKDVVTVDFKDAEAQRSLSAALLSRDFGLKLTLPEGRLCPPIPNRLNYVLWIRDLVDATFSSLGVSSRGQEILGLDIGTGASAIYPLLACALEPSWSLLGTEIDPISYSSAVSNVTQNGLDGRIRIVLSTSSSQLLNPLLDEHQERFAFTMCNPPFYGSTAEVERSADGKALEPNAVCTGAEVEMITPGGEAAFVRRIVSESTLVSNRYLWFTSMLGKLSSVGEIVEDLRQRSIDNYALTELTQGQTRRWVVAWSLGDARVPDSIARGLSSTHRALIPLSNTLRQNYPTTASATTINKIVTRVLGSVDGLQIEHSDTEESENAIRVSATRNTWSRTARRQAKAVPPPVGTALPLNPATSTSGVIKLDGDEKPVLAVLLRCSRWAPNSNSPVAAGWTLECSWLRGSKRSLFDGFWGYVSRKVDTSLRDR